MSASVLGVLSWKRTDDDKGHRTYTLKTLVETTSYTDGPRTVRLASGLPTLGSYWSVGSDVDPYAWLTPATDVEPVVSNEPCKLWYVTQRYKTLPSSPEQGPQGRSCLNAEIQNPVNEPPKFSGGTRHDTKPLTRDRFNRLIRGSSFDPILGLEEPNGHPTVKVSFNTYGLVALAYEYLHGVNDSPMWGLPSKTIKLSDFNWTENWYGLCNKYYNNVFDFEINFDGWEMDDIPDTGHKVLRGQWAQNPGTGAWAWVEDAGVNPNNPNDFMINIDQTGKPVPNPIFLDGTGRRLTQFNTPVFIDPVEYLTPRNFLSLGIPASF